MLIPILDERRPGRGESIIQTISTRIAGGKEISTEPSQVRNFLPEFRLRTNDILSGHRRRSRIPVIPAVPYSCGEAACHTGYTHCRRLHSLTRHLRGEEEHSGFGCEFFQWTLVSVDEQLEGNYRFC